MRGTAVAVLAALAFVIAAWMALEQWRLIPGVWDPLGGGQTRQVLDSNVSRMIRRIAHVPDSALGAIAYLVEIVLAMTVRRRSNARLLIVYRLWSAALALAGISLVAMQIFVVHAICFLCCCTATLSVIIFAIAWKET